MPVYSRIYAIPYVVVFLFTMWCYLYEAFEKKYHKSLSIIPITKPCIFAFFMIFVGLRGFVFTDWSSYLFFFRHYNVFPLFSDPNSYNLEYGFLLLLKLVKYFREDYFTFVFISTLFDFILIYFAFKNEKSFALCFVFYYIFSTGGPGFRLEFNLMRNVKSILLFTISLKYVKDNNFFKFLILNIAGSFFHVTALLYIPLFFLLRSNVLLKYSLPLFITGTLVYVFRIKWMHTIIYMLGNIIGGRLGLLISAYTQSSSASSAYGLNIAFFQKFFAYLIIKIFEKKLVKDKGNKIYISVFYLFIVVNLFCSEMNIFIIRIAMLFVMGYWIVFPRLYFILRPKGKKIFLVVLLAFGLIKLLGPATHVMMRYDNVLFGYQSENERKMLLFRE